MKEHPQCNYCYKRFDSKEMLGKHLDKDHLCQICGEYVSNSKLHKSSHPWCNHCNKRFLNSDDFFAHLEACYKMHDELLRKLYQKN
jgi:hypothetical protein